MTVAVLLILAGLVLLFAGGEGLVRGGSRLALRLGISPLVVGLTVVAFGTSCPELMVCIKAATDGQGAIAAGNVVGSNIANLGLILGLTALVSPVRVQPQLIRFDAPILIMATLAGAWVLADGAVGRLESWPMFLGLLIYLVLTVRWARAGTQPHLAEEFEEGLPKAEGSVLMDLVFLAAGLATLVLGARFLVEGSVTVARQMGISEAVIGLTVVAIGTSMPELATALVAAYRRQADLAVGNLIGSNIFNILGILALTGLVQPFEKAGMTAVDISFMLALTLVLLPLMRTGFIVKRWEGALLLALYLAYMGWLWPK